MDDTNYDLQKDPWYPPHKIIDYFELLRSQCGSAVQNDKLFKKAREMFSAAVALFGAYELSPENKYYLQINNQGSSPDVMAATRTKMEDGSILLAMNQIEVVEMEEHANTDDIVQFLLNTKLSSRKAYSNKMMILCFVNRVISIKHREVHERLKQISPKSTIYICGRPINGPMGNFIIFSPYPILTEPITYNINETAKKYTLKPRVMLSLGKADTMVPTGTENVNVYQVLGLDQKKIYQKFKSLSPIKRTAKINSAI